MIRTERDPLFPLAIGVVWAILLHMIAWPVMAKGFNTNFADFFQQLSEIEIEPQPSNNTVKIGEDNSLVPQIAWISYDDYQQLIAPENETEQPALQATADPVPGAPLIVDATKPNAKPANDATPMTASEENSESESQKNIAEQNYNLPITSKKDIEVPMTKTAKLNKVGQSGAIEIANAQDKKQASSGNITTKARPTSSPKTETESPATTLRTPNLPIRPGQVFTYGEVKVKTRIPRFSIEAIMTSLGTARNPKALVEFNPKGEVIAVKFTRKTGMPNIDAPVLASLYGWKASGPGLKKHRTVIIDVTVLLH